MVLYNAYIKQYKQFFLPKMVSLKTFLNKKFNEIVILGLRLVPLHPYDGCKWIRCRGETFDVYEAPPPLACILVLETSGSYNYELALCILMI